MVLAYSLSLKGITYHFCTAITRSTSESRGPVLLIEAGQPLAAAHTPEMTAFQLICLQYRKCFEQKTGSTSLTKPIICWMIPTQKVCGCQDCGAQSGTESHLLDLIYAGQNEE